MKGIILAGGAGSRLYPLTQVITKQLQPIYDKPMIYYPISLLMLGGVKDILIISTPQDAPHFERLLGNGSKLGLNIQYATQNAPKGIPEAFLIGEKFIAGDDVNLVLGDNLFYGDIGFYRRAIKAQTEKTDQFKGRVFAYPVKDPERYGVVEFEKKTKKVLSIEEKPSKPRSNYAIPGLYLFDGSVVERAKSLKPSDRGETEIVDIIRSYFKEGTLGVEAITRGVAWLDTGTPQSMLEASSYIAAIEQRQGLKVACLEEIALRMNYIDHGSFEALVSSLPKSPYREYLEDMAKEI